MVGANIDVAVEKLEGNTIKIRNEGLSGLRRFLNAPYSSARIRSVDDDGWHKVLETLFSLVKIDLQSARNGSDTAKKRAVDRLNTSVEAIKLVVEACTSLIKHKTAYSVLDHIQQTVPLESDEIFQYVRNVYYAAFRTILSYPAHGEHLRPERWTLYVDFVLQAIEEYFPFHEGDGDRSFRQEAKFISTAREIPALMSQLSQGNQTGGARDDLLATLRDLSSITNSPLQVRIGQISSTVCNALSQQIRSPELAFEVLANTLKLSLTEDVELSRWILAKVILYARIYWTTRLDPQSMELREQILICLHRGRDLLQVHVLHDDEQREALRKLESRLSTDYQNRTEVLSLPDLFLTSFIAKQDTYSVAGIVPNAQSQTAMLDWATASIVGYLKVQLAMGNLETESRGAQEPLPKRQKNSNALIDALRPATMSNTHTAVISLQFAFFMLNDILNLSDGIIETFSQLLTVVSDEQSPRSSWIFLVFARLATSRLQRTASLQSLWSHAWTAASPLVTSSRHSRAACFLLHTLLQSSLIDSTTSGISLSNVCFPYGIRGPAQLSDASLLLLASSVSSGLLGTEKQIREFMEKILSWLDSNWIIKSTTERAHNQLLTRMARPVPLCNLISVMLGNDSLIEDLQSSLAESRLYLASCEDKYELSLVNFIFGSNNNERPEALCILDHEHPYVNLPQGSFRSRVTDLLQAKLSEFVGHLHDVGESQGQKWSTDMLMATSTIVAVMSSLPIFVESQKDCDQLFAAWQIVLASATQAHEEEFQSIVARSAHAFLQVYKSCGARHGESMALRNLLLSELLRSAEHSNQAQLNSDDFDTEFAESARSVSVQQSQSRSQKLDLFSARKASSIPSYQPTNPVETRARLYLERLLSDESTTSTRAANMIDLFVNMTAEDLISAKNVLLLFLDDLGVVTNSAACHLLRKLAETCLQHYDFERNEVALCLCLHAMISLNDMWLSTTTGELSDLAFDIYSWYINVALGKGIASSRALHLLAQLLDVIMRTDADYGIQEGLPSPRTNLLKILQMGSMSLKFRLVPCLINVFDGFILTEHAAVFDDIVNVLPTDPDAMAGIAVRVYILAKLGSRWQTVLRQATYHIFETAANVPKSTVMSQQALNLVCNEIQIATPQELLHLFVPQILYTWLETSSVETIPFRAFSYSTLDDFLAAEHEEIVAQLTIRQDQKHIDFVESALQQPWASQLEVAFPRAQVYAISTDLTIYRSGAQEGLCEKTVIDIIGTEHYAAISCRRFSEAVALTFLALSDDKGVDKLLSSSRSMSSLQAYQQITERSSSTFEHPPRQQPSFRVKFLLQVLAKLALRAKVQFEDMWIQPLLIYVCRRILDDASPAIGPLHVASAIRRLRIVVVLAGDAMLSGTVLEMVLRNLEPYITTYHCVDDCIGIIWYLLEEGSTYLATSVTFLTELTIRLFHSLASLAATAQESTTQEADFIATVSKAKEFRNWTSRFLENLSVTTRTESQKTRFQQIIRFAKDVDVYVSNHKSSAGASLLKQLIQDQASEDPLLHWNAFRSTLLLLTKDFRLLNGTADDIFDSDVILLHCVPVLVKISRLSTLSAGFQAWLGGRLGYALLLAGPELHLNDDQKVRQNHEFISVEPSNSRRNILHVLADTAVGDNSAQAGHAERTISLLLSTMSADDRYAVCSLDERLRDLRNLAFAPDECPGLYIQAPQNTDFFEVSTGISQENDTWLVDLAITLTTRVNYDPFMVGLAPMLQLSPSFVEQVLPELVHLALFAEMEQGSQLQTDLSSFIGKTFQATYPSSQKTQILLLQVIVYLRSCAMPKESTMAARNAWLLIDYNAAAYVALSCGQPETALLMIEIGTSEKALHFTRSRRTSVRLEEPDKSLLNRIFAKVDDHDFFYGDYKELDLSSVLLKLQHEDEGEKALSFQSALLDAGTKTRGLDDAIQIHSTGIVTALNLANLDSLACMTQQFTGDHSNAAMSTGLTESFLNVHQWDLIPSEKSTQKQTALQNVLQKVGHMTDRETVSLEINNAYRAAVSTIISKSHSTVAAKHYVPLAALAEIDNVLRLDRDAKSPVLSDIVGREFSWSPTTSFEILSPILLAREATLAAMRTNQNSQESAQLTGSQALLLEIQAIRRSLSTALIHDERQFSLNRAAYLIELGRLAEASGLQVQTVTKYDLARTLWAQGEITAPIEILRKLQNSTCTDKEDIEISRSELLTELGQKLSEARLDRPDEVIAQYLQPAIQALGDHKIGSGAGKVFHNYAAFCDHQLQDSTGIDDYKRAQGIYTRKKQEVTELADMVKNSEGKTKDVMKMHYSKAKTWLKLDEEDFLRLQTNRATLLYSSLENYLLSLQACDDFSNDILRLLSLWLSSSADDAANASVQQYLPFVATVKFAPFVNQLMSRLLQNKERFQSLLFDLLFRISCDHPYHSLYQLFATWKTRGSNQDDIARSRHKTAGELAKTIQGCKKPSAHIWIAIHNSSITTVYFANEKTEKDVKTGTKIALRKFQHGKKLEQDFANLATKIPPPTMKIPLKRDKDYSTLPVLDHFDPFLSIAGGVSAPKIVTVVASDSSRHKMLLKGGNDDLRQDAIMEQVFEQVSNLLKEYRSTRERKLSVRTYKVIPLTQNAGIIEFVQNTIPLHDFLLPAHQRYFPKDYKPNQCRRAIADVQTKPVAARLQAFRTVVDNFHPVMRFFFMEHFLDPNDWFQRRLAYSRSTAAISMLGHVLGLGDRHGHNILLDTQSGEVVHIDLGVAFESGRVLPVPEVVPFRLTRDLVDGMGLSGVEGPFRRCCNFTLEALRKNQDAILTILDVLRYDPLYSWSVSPLRLQRMQEAQERETAAATTSVSTGTGGATEPAQKAENGVHKTTMVNEPGEAERALAVVAKKLSKGLSVEATVNELIRQATDERNLAVLYCGWAAYA